MNWEKLGNLGKIISGSTPSTTIAKYWDGTIPWVTPADLAKNADVFFVGTPRMISEEGYNSCSTVMLPAGSILFSSRAPIGHCAVASYPVCTNQGLKSVVPNSKLDSLYGYFALKHFTDDITVMGHGATFDEVTKEMMEGFEIPIPPPTEQRRIAAILRAADDERRRRRYTQTLSDGLLGEVFVQMFGDPATNPMGWETAPLYKLCSSVIDCPHSTPTYSELETPYLCVRSSDIQGGYLDRSTTKYLTEVEYTLRTDRGVPQYGDILYCREGARLGNAARMPSNQFVALGQRMMLYRINQHISRPEFVWAALEAGSIKEVVWKSVGGSASPHVNIRDLSQLRIIVPPLHLQDQFAQVVREHDLNRELHLEATRQCNHLFDTLLHRAFAAEL